MNAKRTKTLPAQEYLRECFDYDPETGELRWKERPQSHFATLSRWKWWNTRYATKLAGTLFKGYWNVGINNVLYAVHRIIWKLLYGVDPIEIDHRDGNGSNNRLENLRNCTTYDNARNRASRGKNLRGTYYESKKKRWRSRISTDNGIINLGCFKTEEAAYKAYCEAALKYHGEFARFD